MHGEAPPLGAAQRMDDKKLLERVEHLCNDSITHSGLQVPAASDKTFWDSATNCMKIVVRSSKKGTCSKADEPSLAGASSRQNFPRSWQCLSVPRKLTFLA